MKSNIERPARHSSNTNVMPSCLSHGSLFSGIGGFDLAAKWMNWTNVFQCEKDEWCRRVLAKNFPGTKRYADIKEFNAKEYYGAVDIISGGFPCQPFSVAGKRKGKDDDRYLWEEMLRVVGEVAPPFVVGENVTGIIGLALDTVLSDLEAQGYTTETFIIPACSKNAWHRRDRVWIMAYANSIGWENEQKENGKSLHNKNRNNKTKEQSRRQQQCRAGKSSAIFPDTNNTGRKEQREQFTDGEKFFAPQCSSWWEVEPGVGRVANGLSGRVDRLKGLGNAIVPQVALEIFKALESVHRHCP
jgi:DNA (cytosine-5)-methyltransferase 1